MIQGIVLVADGVEETELVSLHDVLTRTGKINLHLVSISEQKSIITSMGLKLLLEESIDEIEEKNFDFIALPGGKKGVYNISSSIRALKLIREFAASNKLICAICAAPSILGNLGLLKEKNYTCFPGFESNNGNNINEPVVIDNNLISARSMAYTIPFAEQIVLHYLKEEGLSSIYSGMRGIPYPTQIKE